MTNQNVFTYSLTAFPVATRTTKTGKVQHTQTYQLDQAGRPAQVFTRTSMTPDRFPPAGPVACDLELYLKPVKNEAGYINNELTPSLKNIRAFSAK